MIDAMTANNRDSELSMPPTAIGDPADAAAFDEMSQNDDDSMSEGKKPLSVAQASVHAGLDAAALIPGEGHIAAGVNAVDYASQRHYGEAALSALETVVPLSDELGGMAGLLKVGAHVGAGGFGIGHAELNKRHDDDA